MNDFLYFNFSNFFFFLKKKIDKNYFKFLKLLILYK